MPRCFQTARGNALQKTVLALPPSGQPLPLACNRWQAYTTLPSAKGRTDHVARRSQSDPVVTRSTQQVNNMALEGLLEDVLTAQEILKADLQQAQQAAADATAENRSICDALQSSFGEDRPGKKTPGCEQDPEGQAIIKRINNSTHNNQQTVQTLKPMTAQLETTQLEEGAALKEQQAAIKAAPLDSEMWQKAAGQVKERQKQLQQDLPCDAAEQSAQENPSPAGSSKANRVEGKQQLSSATGMGSLPAPPLQGSPDGKSRKRLAANTKASCQMASLPTSLPDGPDERKRSRPAHHA
ncbi:hypothetical protein WJX74_010408 [Apatococcus lobatus]|uniref:Uncharacterized protein n=1 Tax=Apatococcus lobatus TaxID=904363 RepID=A0AAW1SFL3_9CHLO